MALCSSEQTRGTNEANDLKSDMVLRRRGARSSSFYKFAHVIAREQLDVTCCATLAEGLGSVSAMLVRDDRCKALFYSSLHPFSEFIEGKQDFWMPPCLCDVRGIEKVQCLRESVLSSNDLTDEVTVVNIDNLMKLTCSNSGQRGLSGCYPNRSSPQHHGGQGGHGSTLCTVGYIPHTTIYIIRYYIDIPTRVA